MRTFAAQASFKPEMKPLTYVALTAMNERASLDHSTARSLTSCWRSRASPSLVGAATSRVDVQLLRYATNSAGVIALRVSVDRGPVGPCQTAEATSGMG